MDTPSVGPGETLLSLATLKRSHAARWKTICDRHAAGASGREVAAALTSAYDETLLRVIRATLDPLPPHDRERLTTSLAVVAVGGYGRGDLALHSDVDLLFLHADDPAPAVLDSISALVRNLWDVGLRLAQSVRTPEDAARFARDDLKTRTALQDARLLAGPAPLFEDLRGRIREGIASTSIRRFLNDALAIRSREHTDYYAETVCLLEPNVKKSAGGLRDVHLLRWLAMARYGTADLATLAQQGHLASNDTSSLEIAFEFLRRIRNELHRRAGSAQDVLTRDEQLRLAPWLGFEQEGPLLGVERFMQQYYRHTTNVHDITMRFVDRLRDEARRRTRADVVAAQRLNAHCVLMRNRIVIDPAVSADALTDAAVLLGFFDLARCHGVAADSDSLERIRAAVPTVIVTPAARERFLACLGNPSAIGPLLRNLHRIGLLSRFVPPFEHARCLIQFNLFHHYTVDEHSIRAVEMASRRMQDPGALGQAYRQIHRKDLLHLALLLHDLGKGMPGDHSEVGERIAGEVGEQFGLPAEDRHLLCFLVRQHLLMAHTALRRDLADAHTVMQFTRAVATPKALRMLYVLTAADTEAVAPGEWTAWKESLLTELYYLASEELTGSAPVGDEEARVRSIRERLLNVFGETFAHGWLANQLGRMPDEYLLATEPERVERHLHVLRHFEPGGVRVQGDYDAALRLSRYTVFAWDGLTPGIFSKITGTLASVGFQIVDAQIVTRADGLVIDTFRGIDGDFADEPPFDRRAEVAQHIEDILCGRECVEALWARRGRPIATAPATGPAEPPQVEIDNDSSHRFTIIDVFAADRRGLLYRIAKALFECGLSVYSAKISTHYNQVVDAFYVTAQGGAKVTDEQQCETIRRRLLDAVR